MLSLLIAHVGRRAVVAAGTVALVSTVACSDDVTAPKPAAVIPSASSAIDLMGTPILIDLPPVVDGVIGANEYAGAEKFSFPVKIPGGVLGFGSTADVYVTHDATYLYLAVVFDRKSLFRPNDHVSFEWDLDHNGEAENGDDIVGLHAFTSAAWDFYRFNNGVSNQSDNADGGTNDATGAFGVVGTVGVFEIRKEINSGDHLHDMGLVTALGAQRLGMRTMIALESGRVGSGTLIRSWEPDQTSYCRLDVGKNFTTVNCS